MVISQGIGHFADRRAGPVAGAESFGKRDFCRRRVDHAAGGADDPVPGNDERSGQLGDLFEPFTDPFIAQITFFACVAADRVITDGAAVGHHLFGVADHEHRADLFSLTPLAADTDRQFDDQTDRFRGNVGVEFAELLPVEFLLMLVKFDNAD